MSEQQNERRPMYYRVGSIEKTDAPEDDSGAEWYSYTIEHETTCINGKRSGTLHSVIEYLDEYVEKLNSRPYLGFSPYSARRGKNTT